MGDLLDGSFSLEICGILCLDTAYLKKQQWSVLPFYLFDHLNIFFCLLWHLVWRCVLHYLDTVLCMLPWCYCFYVILLCFSLYFVVTLLTYVDIFCLPLAYNKFESLSTHWIMYVILTARFVWHCIWMELCIEENVWQ